MVTKENLYNNFWRDFKGEIVFHKLNLSLFEMLECSMIMLSRW